MLEDAVAAAMAATGVAQPRLTAALTAAAYRTVHLESIRRILAGDTPTDHVARIRATVALVDELPSSATRPPSSSDLCQEQDSARSPRRGS